MPPDYSTILIVDNAEFIRMVVRFTRLRENWTQPDTISAWFPELASTLLTQQK